jgi:hypothetical protein
MSSYTFDIIVLNGVKSRHLFDMAAFVAIRRPAGKLNLRVA